MAGTTYRGSRTHAKRSRKQQVIYSSEERAERSARRAARRAEEAAHESLADRAIRLGEGLAEDLEGFDSLDGLERAVAQIGAPSASGTQPSWVDTLGAKLQTRFAGTRPVDEDSTTESTTSSDAASAGTATTSATGTASASDALAGPAAALVDKLRAKFAGLRAQGQGGMAALGIGPTPAMAGVAVGTAAGTGVITSGADGKPSTQPGTGVTGPKVAQARSLRTHDDIPGSRAGVGGFVENDLQAGSVFVGAARRHKSAQEPADQPARPLGERVLLGLRYVAVRPVLIAAIIVALALSMLYVPVRNLYIANRRTEVLEQTYGVLMDENEQLESEVAYLQTEEGVETEARKHGYVAQGETKVRVEGLPEDNSDEQELILRVGDVELPDERPWYTRLTDAIFGYDPTE
jgi:cell division protein FtsB